MRVEISLLCIGHGPRVEPYINQVGHPVDTILGAQGFGAALGNAIAPHNLIAAAAIVGLGGRESEILRRTLPVTLPLVAAAGVVALVLAT